MKKIYLLLCMVAGAFFMTPHATFSQVEPKVLFDFDSNSLLSSGSTSVTITDSLGTITYPQVVSNTVAKFDGTEGFAFDLDTITSMNSITFFIKPSEAIEAGDPVSVLLETFSGPREYGILFGDGTGELSNETFFAFEGENAVTAARTGITDQAIASRWQAIALVYDANLSRYKIYIDGIEQTTASSASFGHTTLMEGQSFEFGASNFSTTPSGFLDAMIDDFAIYDVALTENQVDSLAKKLDSFIEITDPIVKLSFEDRDLVSTGTHSLTYTEMAGEVGFADAGPQKVAKFNTGAGFTITSDDTTMVMKSIAFYLKPFNELSTSASPTTLLRYTQPGSVQHAIGFGNSSSFVANEVISIFDVVGSQAKYTLVQSTTVDTNWHFFAFVYKESLEKYVMYQDGMELTTIASGVGESSLFANDWFFFSKNLASPTTTLEGYLDEFMIYDRELTSAELTTLSDNLMNYSSDIVGLEQDQLDHEGFLCYPNPVKNQLFLKENAAFQIYSSSGTFQQGGISIKGEAIDVNLLEPGLYFLMTNQGNSTFVKE